MRAIIILNGEINDYNVVRAYIKPEDVIFVADGGIRHLEALQAVPHYIMGDFDSGDYEEAKKYKEAEKVSYPADKNYTDGEIVVLEVLKQKDLFDEVVILGALGGRIDHMMSNMSLLRLFYQNDLKAFICDEMNRIIYVQAQNDEVEVRVFKEGFKYLSIIPLSEELTIMKLEGVKYPLEDIIVYYGSTLCTSNEINEDTLPARICIKSGRGFIIQSVDKLL